MDAAGISHYHAYLLKELKKRGLRYRRNKDIPEGKNWLQVVHGIGSGQSIARGNICGTMVDQGSAEIHG